MRSLYILESFRRARHCSSNTSFSSRHCGGETAANPAARSPANPGPGPGPWTQPGEHALGAGPAGQPGLACRKGPGGTQR